MQERIVLLPWLLPQLLIVSLVVTIEMGFGQQKGGNVHTSPSRRCFVCNCPGHLAKHCYKRVGAPVSQRGSSRGGGYHPHQFGSRGNPGGAHVKFCTTNEPVGNVIMQDCGVQCEEEGHCGLTET